MFKCFCRGGVGRNMRPNVDGQVVASRGRPVCLPSCAPDGLTAFRVAAGGHMGPPATEACLGSMEGRGCSSGCIRVYSCAFLSSDYADLTEYVVIFWFILNFK